MQILSRQIDHQRLITIFLRIVERLKTIIVTGLLIEAVLCCLNIITAFDYPWQAAEGNFILAHGYPPKSVLQSYGEISPNYANEYILYEILIACINKTAGWVGLVIFFGLLELVILAPCLLAFFRSRHNFSLLYLCLFLLGQLLVYIRFAARPELIADVCFMAESMMLIRLSERPWSVLQTIVFGLIFCLWANAHGTFLIGLAILAIWYGQLLFLKWRSALSPYSLTWLKPALAAILGSTVNPFGLARFAQPFQLHGLLWGQATSFEMWPITTDLLWLTLTCTAIGIITLLLKIKEQNTYWVIFTLLAFEYLTFRSNRYEVFIGLTLLVIVWNGANTFYTFFSRPTLQMPFALSQLIIHLYIIMELVLFIGYTANTKLKIFNSQIFFPKTIVAIDSSFLWLRRHPTQNYFLLSDLDISSWSQIPNCSGIHPLLDSGTHRYSDRVNQLYYYIHFSPEIFTFAITNLDINTVVLGRSNMYWAPILNANPNWSLTQIEYSSQLYVRRNKQSINDDKTFYTKWEQFIDHRISESARLSYQSIIRGFGLRSNEESLKMLLATDDAAWMFDPQIYYVQDWLKQLPEDLIKIGLNGIGNRSGNSSEGLRIIFSLRLGQNNQAAEIAKKWNPSSWDEGSHDMQELRAEAFLSVSDTNSARRILESLWPQPRYSLRWATLCQRAYVDRSWDMPKNAQLLTSLLQNNSWCEDTIKSLNLNISRLSSPAPYH